MADTFPSTYVDSKNGEIKQIQTFAEKLRGDYLPEAGHVGILGLKLAALARSWAAWPLRQPPPTGIFLAGRWSVTKVIDMVHEKLLLQHKQGDFIEFDLHPGQRPRRLPARIRRHAPEFRRRIPAPDQGREAGTGAESFLSSTSSSKKRAVRLWVASFPTTWPARPQGVGQGSRHHARQGRAEGPERRRTARGGRA